MNPCTQFFKEYAALRNHNSDCNSFQYIKQLRKDSLNSKGTWFAASIGSIHINLHGLHLNEVLFAPIAKSLSAIGPALLSIDLSFNQQFGSRCVLHLQSIIAAAPALAYLSLERTGLAEEAAVSVVSSLASMNAVRTLNLSSNKLGLGFFQHLGRVLQGGSLARLRDLNLGTTKMGDQGAMAFMESLVASSRVEHLNITTNNLRCRSGAHLLEILTLHPETPLRRLDLAYNALSQSLLKGIEKTMQDIQSRPLGKKRDSTPTPNLEGLKEFQAPCVELDNETQEMVAKEEGSGSEPTLEHEETQETTISRAVPIQDARTWSFTPMPRSSNQPRRSGTAKAILAEIPTPGFNQLSRQTSLRPKRDESLSRSFHVGEEKAYKEEQKVPAVGTFDKSFAFLKRRIQSNAQNPQNRHPFYARTRMPNRDTALPNSRTRCTSVASVLKPSNSNTSGVLNRGPGLGKTRGSIEPGQTGCTTGTQRYLGTTDASELKLSGQVSLKTDARNSLAADKENEKSEASAGASLEQTHESKLYSNASTTMSKPTAVLGLREDNMKEETRHKEFTQEAVNREAGSAVGSVDRLKELIKKQIQDLTEFYSKLNVTADSSLNVSRKSCLTVAETVSDILDNKLVVQEQLAALPAASGILRLGSGSGSGCGSTKSTSSSLATGAISVAKSSRNAFKERMAFSFADSVNRTGGTTASRARSQEGSRILHSSNEAMIYQQIVRNRCRPAAPQPSRFRAYCT